VILHKLIWRFLRYRDDEGFYRIQAEDTVRWLERQGLDLGAGTSVLDLGCGHGMIGGELLGRGCRVTFADESNWLLPEYSGSDFRVFDIEKDDIGSLGTFDLVICSNVLEHISDPMKIIGSMAGLLNPEGHCYLSWTNAWSPWWGHEFTPFHYLGARRGVRIFDRISKRQRKHTPFVNLFPYSISRVLRLITDQPGLEITRLVPRYYPELTCIMKVPLLREPLAWNCAVLVRKRSAG
jgi:SAM-dependent methyltransferase